MGEQLENCMWIKKEDKRGIVCRAKEKSLPLADYKCSFFCPPGSVPGGGVSGPVMQSQSS